MAYVYRHIRLDNNEPFYIGIGEDLIEEEGKFRRANHKKNRSIWWKNITTSTKYRVDIVQDDLTWEEACEKEIFFIALYGRRDKGLGPLVNLTDGGEGTRGYKHTQETLEKKSKAMTGKKQSKEVCDNRSKNLKGKPKPEGWGASQSIIKKGVPKPEGFGENHSKLTKGKPKPGCWKPIIQKDKQGNFIREWSSQTEASKELNINIGSLCSCLKGKYKTAGGFIWEYKQILEK